MHARTLIYIIWGRIMPWDREIYTNRELSHEEIVATLGTFFNIKMNHIVVSENHEWVNTHDDDTCVACDISYFKGDFPLCLWIAHFPAKFETYPPFNLEAVGTLCEMFDCHALVAIGDFDPGDDCMYTLVRSKADYQVVEVDVRHLDSNHEFVITKYL
jgi:hypothetical protein